MDGALATGRTCEAPACFLCGHLTSKPVRLLGTVKLALCWRHEDAVVEVEEVSKGTFRVTATCLVTNKP